MSVDEHLPDAPVHRRVPIEGQGKDVDGTPVLVNIHVIDGRLTELEILRADSEPIVHLPTADSLDIEVMGE